LDISPEDRGTYTLLIQVREDVEVGVGRLGRFTFEKGLYTYTGSAVGKGSAGLKRRIERHLSRVKRRRWHIDHLLAAEAAKVIGVVYTVSCRRLECHVSRSLEESPFSKVVVLGFGSSDCRSGCQAHLHCFPAMSKEALTSLVQEIYRRYSPTKPFHIAL